jgi:rhodanese-related sulfurtransferase
MTRAPRTLDELLAEAGQRIERHPPSEAREAMETGAALIDIRSVEDRARDGIVPGSLHIPRTVLEWRLAPGGAWRNPFVGGPEQQLILICDHGCSTILAASALVDLGYTRVGDVIGGFDAWRGAGLPTIAAPLDVRGPDELPGMRGQD